ncbi:MAG: N-acetylmuramoyl-L-alanine amidase [Phenylobacterium sp.]|uniref:N-acetylmuramoyl-L-alanine amidase n=2 Tax=Phenylobacterium sp. TaxID=1871053 RepID=UPI0025E1025B|nr:N-acetylmuramoyl-L-alanine amidase [Phenylobacterium sp.]MCA3708649.1 N-acetylmuramoyl-L-alanine amidase [Phenylobacterium sp.]MCA3738654.1 N-acetylmuramoyl-L-alanine amidase [Phenylobacterium sp.]
MEPTLDTIDAPSPNFDARTAPPDMIVLHYTGMTTGEAALARLCDPTPGGRVSAHYLVEEDGRLFRLVDEARRAWHAGVASWKGERDINGRSIGVEIVNPGHEFGYRDFPEPQVAAVIALLTDIRSRWTIADGDIVGHSDVAPARKQDPGERFPWKQLAQAGHGLWVEPPPAPGAPLAEGAEGAAVFAFQAGLTRLGYDCPPSGRFDTTTREVVSAFQRHWVQSRFDGVADGLTRARLIALLRLSGA